MTDPGSILLIACQELGDAVRRFLGPLRARAFLYEWVHQDSRVDTLRRAVTDAVAATALGDQDPRVTFGRVRGLTDAMAGTARPTSPAPAGRPRAGAASDRALVLLSGVHRRPVGPLRELRYSIRVKGVQP